MPRFFVFQSPWRFLSLLLMLALLAGCGSSPKMPSPAFEPALQPAASQTEATLSRLYQQHADWRGTPYRLGGQSRHGIDCSAFVQKTYQDLFGLRLPRTTSQQFRAGQTINKSDLQPGDLVFFRNGNHVGIYLEEDRFLHASTRLGVTISSMNNIYWSRKYWRSIRVRPE
jgi:cell wall-associated NlpC family hydrolase